MSFLAAIFLLGVLIFVHEFGHFIFAKIFGVKVEVFSLGFGPRLVGIQIGETDYRISLVPLGGYVKLLGEQPDEFGLPLPPDERARTLEAQPFWKKAVILVAGPTMNIVFPLFLYLLVALAVGGEPVTLPELGAVYGKPAIQAGLQPGDRIVAVNDEEVKTWSDLQRLISAAPGKEVVLTVKRKSKTIKVKVIPEPIETTDVFGDKQKVGRIGVSPDYPPPIVGVPPSAKSALEAGLRTGDLILAVNGHEVKRWIDFVANLQAARGKEVKLRVSRPKQIGDYSEPDEITLRFRVPENDPLGGMLPPDTYVGKVNPDTILGKILKPGDRILEVDGVPIRHFYAIYSLLESLKDREFRIVYERDGLKLTATASLTKTERKGPYKDLGPIYRLGVRWIASDLEPYVATGVIGRSFGELLVYPVEQTARVLELGGKSLWYLVSGKLSLKQLGGPIMIVDVARRAYTSGFVSYVNAMALISVSLGILNLLPIPLLDGGQLVMYGVEAVRRRPLPLEIREKINFIGLMILLALMILVFKNDIERYWDSIVAWFSGR